MEADSPRLGDRNHRQTPRPGPTTHALRDVGKSLCLGLLISKLGMVVPPLLARCENLHRRLDKQGALLQLKRKETSDKQADLKSAACA